MDGDVIAYYLSIGVVVHFMLMIVYWRDYKKLPFHKFVFVTAFTVVAWPIAISLYVK